MSTNSLTGIKTSQITPSYTYNTVNHPITPTAGKSIFITLPFAGSILGGNVNTINPTGVKPLANSFDTVGLFARCVDEEPPLIEVADGRAGACWLQEPGAAPAAPSERAAQLGVAAAVE